MTEFILFLVFGLVCGFTGYHFYHFRPDGNFEMDSRNPEKDIWRIVLDVDIDKIPRKRYLVLRVKPHAELQGGNLNEQY